MPANRVLGRSASQVAFRKARAKMAELYCKGYSPSDIILGVTEELASGLSEAQAPLLTDMARAVMLKCNRPGVPNLRDIRANRDFAACDMGEA